jgi:hypothetical protein
MTGTSTLFYLVDDINNPSDMLLTPYQEHILKDEHFTSFLNLLEVDPGDDLVLKTLERLEVE